MQKRDEALKEFEQLEPALAKTKPEAKYTKDMCNLLLKLGHLHLLTEDFVKGTSFIVF